MAEIRLREWRERKALSQRELARLAGVSQFSISKIENGQRKARPSTVRKLAEALGLMPEELFEGPGGRGRKRRALGRASRR